MMKYGIRYLLIIMTLWPVIIKSQDYIPLYSDYLPIKISTDRVLRKLVNDRIEYYAKLNPDLIYYFLKYLDLYYGQQIFDKNQNSLNYLYYLENSALESKKEWAWNEISDVRKMNLNHRLKGEICAPYIRYSKLNTRSKKEWAVGEISNLSRMNFDRQTQKDLSAQYKIFFKSDSIETEKNSFPYAIDENVQNLIVYRYYQRRKCEYDSNTNYRQLRMEYEQEYLNSLENKYVDEKYYKNTTGEIKSIFYNWNIFKNNHNPSYSSSQILSRLLTNNFNVTRKKNLSVGIGMLLYKNINKGSYTIKEINTKIVYSDELPAIKQLEPALLVEYKKYIKDYYDTFAFVKFRVGVSKYLSAKQFNIPGGSDKYYYTTPSHTYLNEVDEVKVHVYSSACYSLQVASPVYYLNNNLYIEFSLNTVFNRVKYEAEYRFKVTRDGSQIAYTNYNNIKIYSDKWALLPGLNLNFSINPRLTSAFEIYFNSKLMLYTFFEYNITLSR